MLLSIGSFDRTIVSASQQKPSDDDTEKKIDELISKMTLEEKFGQLQQLDGEANGKYRPEHIELARKGLLGSTLNVRGAKETNELQRAALQSRLKIPILFGFDVIHGYRTIFPVPLGETASFDLDLMEKTAAAAAAESRASGVHWTFAPMVDIARDPRWGRVIEGAGEDVFLGEKVAAARVRGFQGDDYSRPDKVMATAKHWVGYGAAEAGRDYNSAELSKRSLREIYFPPFKAAVDAGVGSLMTSFNDLDGLPSTANPFILKDVLRKQWGFDGLVVSDYTSVMELIFHGIAKDGKDAARLALNAGTDMEMVSRNYVTYGPELVREGKVSMKTIDDAVRHVLRVKFRAGLFDHPFVDDSLESKVVFSKEHRALAKTAAERSFVLLKNEDRTLPVSKDVRKIAVIGGLADNKSEMNGNWSGDGRPEDPVTVLEALKNKLPNADIRFANGCDPECSAEDGFGEAVKAVADSDFAILVIGESAAMSGEAASRSDIGLPGKQLELVKRIHATGKPYAVVLMNGRPLTIDWLAENSPAILETWFPGTEAGPAIVDTLFGDADPGGKLPITFPRSVGQIPIYYSHKNTGRPYKADQKYTSKYLDIPNTPLYPFGYGLSYTTFDLSDLRTDRDQILPDGRVKVTVDVENTGKRAGDEVVQLYLQDVVASVTRPVRELRGFRRITLEPGEKKTVAFTLGPDDLSLLDKNFKRVVEPGEFRVMAGTDSSSGLQTSFEVVEQLTPKSKKVVVNEPVGPGPSAPAPVAKLSAEDDAFVEDLEKRAFRYFWENSNPANGLTLDRSGADGDRKAKGDNSYNIASSAATGFALSSYCIAADRGWIKREEALKRTKATLRFFADKAYNKNGWFYHWLDYETGKRRWNSEISSIDTALLMGGVLTVKGCFADDEEVTSLADRIYRRIDFEWMLNGDPHLLSHGWRPETGFIPSRWRDYSEDKILYFLAIGSPTHPIPASSWYAWERTWMEYDGYRYLAAVPPLFIHQFTHAWVDYRNKREHRAPNVDYYENSVIATRAQRDFSSKVLSRKFPTYSDKMWGLTASDSEKGYLAWGAPPSQPQIDGTVVPCAPAGSLMFLPDATLAVLKNMRSLYGAKVYKRYGFVDAFNPRTGWTDSDVIGIDVGISLLSAENLRSGKVWYWFMQSDEIRRAMKRAAIY